MTYGWAILVVLIAIAALYAMGVFSGGGATSCKLDAPFACDVVLTAAVGGDNFAITAQGLGTGATYSISTTGTECTAIAGASLTSGAPITLTCTGITAASKGQTVKGEVSVTYTLTGSTLSKKMTGTWSTTVTA